MDGEDFMTEIYEMGWGYMIFRHIFYPQDHPEMEDQYVNRSTTETRVSISFWVAVLPLRDVCLRVARGLFLIVKVQRLVNGSGRIQTSKLLCSKSARLQRRRHIQKATAPSITVTYF